MVAICVGWTDDEVRQFVHEYHLQPYGTKSSWLREQGVTRSRFRVWQMAVFEGDLDRALVPREGASMSESVGKRSGRERQLARERAAHDAEVARLKARVSELEETNALLGKAIGLLQQMSEQEPDANPRRQDPSDS